MIISGPQKFRGFVVIAGVALLSSAASVGLAQVNIVQNGGFESGFASWTTNGNTDGLSAGVNDAHSGFRSLIFGNVDTPGFVSQTLTTVAGRSYLLSFWVKTDSGGVPNEFIVQWNGSTILDQSGITMTDWTNRQFTVTATAGSTVLTFGGWDNPDFIYVDDVSVTAIASIAGRRIFYNNSAWDGDAGASSNDDLAIATDKAALLPGGTATFANYSSYYKGINGVMVDISGLAGTPTASDFTFKLGNNNTPGSWTNAFAPASITVRAAAGVGGSDRVTMIWADNAIQQVWLQVTVKATGNTGLSSDDVFYFGSAIGDTGDTFGNNRVIVNTGDESGVRLHPTNTVNNPGAPIDFLYDFDRDKRANTGDESIVRLHPMNGITGLLLISPPAASAPVAKSGARIGAPSTGGLVLARGEGRLLRLSVSGAKDNYDYELQAAQDLFSGLWRTLSVSSQPRWDIAPSASEEFYRVLILPPGTGSSAAFP